MDYVVFGFLAAVCVLTGVLFGLAPALQVSRTNVNDVLKEGGRGNAGGRRMRWLTGTMVVVEVALTIVLLVGAGLMVRSFLNLYKLDIGIRDRAPDGDAAPALGRQVPETGGAPRVLRTARAAAVVDCRRRGHCDHDQRAAVRIRPRPLEVDGRPAPKIDDAPSVGVVTISPSFFQVAGVSIVRGRGFTEADGAPGAETAIINEQMAAEHFKGEDPLGKRIRFMQGPPPAGQPAPAPPVWRTVVGISPTIRHSSPQDAESPSVVYVPYRQDAPGFAMVHGAQRAAALDDHGRGAPRGVGRRSRSTRVQPADAGPDAAAGDVAVPRVRHALRPLRVHRPAACQPSGLYAVVAYSVTQRTQEIGVRMALGAQGRQVTWMILRRGLIQLAMGLAIGLFGGFFAGKALPAQILVQTTSTDPATFIAISVLLSVVAITACVVPARRAMRVDPLVALRAE